MRLLPTCFAASLLFAAAAGADSIIEVPLPANDLIYHAASGSLFASVPGNAGGLGNTIARVVPTTGEVLGAVPIGSEPGSLALTDDGQFLYVGLTGAAAVRRYEIATNTAGPQWTLGMDRFGQQLFPGRLATLAGQPHAYAVARGAGNSSAPLVVYDDGTPRPYLTPQYNLPTDDVIGSQNPARLYGVGFYESLSPLAVSPQGVGLLPGFGSILGNTYGNPSEFQRGLLFSPSGRAIDPEGGALLGTFSGVSGYVVRVCPDLPHGRVYFLTRDGFGSYCTLRAFDARTFALTGSLVLPDASGPLTSLVRWGTDGLAFGTDQKLYLIRTSLVSQSTPIIDLEASSSPLPAQVPAGETLSYTLTVRNAGPDTATNVTLSDTLPSYTTIVSTAVSQGQAMNLGGVVTARFGDLAPSSTASVTLQVRFAETGTASHRTQVVAFETDTDTSDDQLAANVTVSAPLVAELDAQWDGAKAVCPRKGKCKYTGKLLVRNRGGQDAKGFVVQFYISTTPTLDPNFSPKLAEIKVGKIRAGKSAVVRLNTKSYASNYQYILALIDTSGIVAEANESDNTAAGPLVVIRK